MRQRITVENLKELSPEQQEKLRTWWNVQESDLFAYIGLINTSNKIVIDVDREGYMYDGRDWFPKMDCLPLLSIGQMIELLQDNIRDTRWDPDEENSIQIYRDGDWGRKSHRVSLLDDEICNSLWQAVKEIL